MTVKFKYQDRWVDEDEFAELRRQEQERQAAPELLDLAALPPPTEVEGPNPILALGDRCPAVRRYINTAGRMRSGLSPQDQQTAKEILAKYGGQP